MDKVLLIEDDRQIRELLPRYFAREGFEVLAAGTGYEGLDKVHDEEISLVLLDVNLPDIDGWSVLRRIKEDQESAPSVIMITGRSDIPDRLMGLDLGADDYIVKPFEPLEVIARVKAVLRRYRRVPSSSDELSFRGLKLVISSRSVTRDGKPVPLTAKEFDILVTLAGKPGKVFSRTELYEKAWGDELLDDDHTLEVHINKIRSKLEGPDGIRYITTMRGVGYKFEVSDHEQR